MAGKKKTESALFVNPGIPQPEQVNPDAKKRLKSLRKQVHDPRPYIDGILAGNRTILSRAITLIESKRSDHQKLAREITAACLPYSGKSVRIGITGVPGVGKSTFIESFGNHLIHSGHKLAVLAIDPSSARSGGSILGDKTRMETLASNPHAFIRPSPSGGSLGGVAGKTREAMYLCETAGFDVILIETVGVGQSETMVHSMVDFFLLLMLAGAGDELQGIKRGIMEMADIVAINKADGLNIRKAEGARIEYENALRLFPTPESGWRPAVLTCSARENSGIGTIRELIMDYVTFTQKNGYWESNRSKQAIHWLHQSIKEMLISGFYDNREIQSLLKPTEEKVVRKMTGSNTAAQDLIDRYRKITGQI